MAHAWEQITRGIENTLTRQGAVLIARTLAEGNPVVFTRALLGTGVAADADDLSERTELIAYYAAASIVTKSVNSNGNLVITLSFWNDDVLETTFIDEIALYAKIAGDTSDVLFSYLTFGKYPDVVLAREASRVQRTYDLPYIFGAGSTASVNITPSGLLPASDAVDQAAPGKILRLNADGKLDADITGDAITLGGHGASYYAAADHRHDNATSEADGFLSKEDKAGLDTLNQRVNQDVTTTGVPTFAGLNVDGYIYGARFL